MNNNVPENEDNFTLGVEAGENELGALLSEDLGEVDSNAAADGLGGDGQQQPAPVVEQPVAATPTPTPTPTPAPVTPAVAQQPVVAPVPAPVVPTPVVAPGAPAPVATPAAATPVAQPTAPQPAPVTPAQSAVDPAAGREAYQRFRGETEAALAQGHYALGQEVVDKFNAGDFSDIPKMMARVYLDAYTAAVAHINTHFPNMLESTTQVQNTHAQHETNFFQAWPQLNLKDHGADIKRFGQSYRQMNPNASPEDFIRDVGAQVVVARRLPFQAAAPTPPAPNGGTPPAPTPRAQPKAFTPASGQSGGSPPPQQPTNANKNPFTELAEDVDELDLD